MTQNSLANVRHKYTQLILSGWSNIVQQPDEDNDHTSTKSIPPKEEVFDWKQGKYLVNVPLVIEAITLPDGQYEVHVSIPLNAHVPMSPINKRGKVKAEQVFDLPSETTKDGVKIHLVYGISEKGVGTLSHSAQHKMVKDVAYLYSRIMGIAGRAAECVVHNSGGETQRTNDTGEREITTPKTANLEQPQKETGGTKVRRKVRAKKGTEEPTILAGDDGEILGKRQGNGEG